MDILLAVNGTLMRGLELNRNLIAVGATFVRETTTAPSYRLWSIRDRHPAMVRVAEGGVAVAVEVWSVPAAGVASILLQEPAGLSIGKVRLADGRETLGVLGEPALCEGMREITEYGGWRAYLAARPSSAPAPPPAVASVPLDEASAAAYVDATAAALGLTIDPAHRTNVVRQLLGLLTAAQLVIGFSLPDDVEIAPVFRP